MLSFLVGLVVGAVAVGAWNYLAGDSLDKVSAKGAEAFDKVKDEVKKQ